MSHNKGKNMNRLHKFHPLFCLDKYMIVSAVGNADIGWTWSPSLEGVEFRFTNDTWMDLAEFYECVDGPRVTWHVPAEGSGDHRVRYTPTRCDSMATIGEYYFSYRMNLLIRSKRLCANPPIGGGPRTSERRPCIPFLIHTNISINIFPPPK